MPSIYLAGPIAGLTYEEATSWRAVAAYYLEQFGIQTRSPMRAKEFLRHGGRISAEAYDEVLASDKGIVARDRHDVFSCDLVLVNFLNAPYISVGTPVEFGWANACNKPIVTIMEEGSCYDHPFVRELSGFRVSTLQEGLDIAVAVLGA